MYFFNDKKLARDLHKEIVSEKEQLGYLLVITLLGAIFLTTTFGHFVFSESPPLSAYVYLGDIFYLVLTLACILYSFKINNTGDNKDYIIRYTCLSAPILIKATIIGVILGAITAPIDMALYMLSNPEIAEALQNSIQNSDTSNATESFDFAQMEMGPGYLSAMVIMMLYTYWRYISAFKIACGQKEYK